MADLPFDELRALSTVEKHEELDEIMKSFSAEKEKQDDTKLEKSSVPDDEKQDDPVVSENKHPKFMKKGTGSLLEKLNFSFLHMKEKEDEVSAEYRLVAEEDVLRWSLYALKFGAFSDAVRSKTFGFVVILCCQCVVLRIYYY